MKEREGKRQEYREKIKHAGSQCHFQVQNHGGVTEKGKHPRLWRWEYKNHMQKILKKEHVKNERKPEK